MDLIVGVGLSAPKIKLCIYPMTRPMASAPQPVSTDPASYETALAELEDLLVRLESGNMPLEQLLSGYQRGAELLKFCRGRLEAVENQIKVLDQGVLKTWTAE